MQASHEAGMKQQRSGTAPPATTSHCASRCAGVSHFPRAAITRSSVARSRVASNSESGPWCVETWRDDRAIGSRPGVPSFCLLFISKLAVARVIAGLGAVCRLPRPATRINTRVNGDTNDNSGLNSALVQPARREWGDGFPQSVGGGRRLVHGVQRRLHAWLGTTCRPRRRRCTDCARQVRESPRLHPRGLLERGHEPKRVCGPR